MRTVLRWFALRNLLLFCCAVGIVLLVLKGIGVYHKINWVQTADQYYTQQNWIQAESFYRQAQDNRYLSYEEQHIASRLQELAPISAWSDTVSNTASRLQAALDLNQFDTYLNVYREWTQAQQQQAEQNDKYSNEYGKITQQYGMERLWQQGFSAFRTRFEGALQSNLDNRNYSDESAKWNLLRIPSAYWLKSDNGTGNSSSASNGSTQARNGSSSQQAAVQANQLRKLFENYDTTKLKRLASAGDFNAFLTNASETWQAYQQHQYSGARWVTSLAEEGAQSVIAKDIAAGQAERFVSHAVSFRTAAQQLNLSSSSVLTTIDNEVSSLQEQAFTMTTNKQFQQALDLYTALTPLGDMTQHIARTKLAWAIDEPVTLLQGSNASVSYQHVTGGTNWSAVPVYVVATDQNNTLFFGKMDNDGNASVWSGEIGQTAAQIQSLAVDTQLSTIEQPIVVVQSQSDVEGSPLFSLYAVTGGGLKAIASFAGVSYEVQPDRSIIVHQPIGGSVGQVDIYTPDENGTYSKTDSRMDGGQYTDIAVSEIGAHLNQPIRFTATIVSVDDEGAIVNEGGTYVRLKGNLSFETGTFIVYGQFDGEYESFMPTDSSLSGDGNVTDGNSSAPDGNGDVGDGTNDINDTPAPDEQFEPEYGLGDNPLPGNTPGMNINIPVVHVDSIE
ncbi:hypothetical protein [Paenibacillus kandeliae]|uniref:hypothetical protein n=1 Tax=Paenibacillus kandeliae TaxID=3231269 RepID=UPI00345AF149